MIPILFEYNATSFTTHGIGDLVDCIECATTQNDEGEFELSFTYPVGGELINELTIGRLVYVKANPWQNNQIFRIYGYEKEIGGVITVNCEHISYDLNKIPVKRFQSATNANCNTVLANMKSNAVSITGLSINSFTFSSNVSGTAQTQKGYFEVETPTSARAVILDGEDSIKGCFGGDLVFDNYSVSLQSTGGSDRGVVIEYGVDLMDLNQEENISEMVTGVLPYFTYTADNDNNDPLIAYGTVQYASGTFRTHRVEPLDLTSYFPNQAEHTAPSQAQLNAKAQEWMSKEDGFGQPEVNLTLSYATLGQDVRLYDAVTVKFVKMGIDVKSKVCSYTFDVLNERITEVEVGKTKPSLLFSLEDASRLRKGLLPPERIKNNSITEEKYASNSVGGGAIKSSGISSYHLKDASVTESKIGGGAVSSSKLANGAATEDKIANNAISTPKVKDLSINVNKIVDGAIVTTKLSSNAVTTDKVLNKAITYAKSQYQGTLDQVGINKSDIAAINALFVGYLDAHWIRCTGLVTYDSIDARGSGINATYAFVGGSSVLTSSTGASKNHSHSEYASSSHTHSNYCTTGYASGLVTSHASHCANYRYQSY